MATMHQIPLLLPFLYEFLADLYTTNSAVQGHLKFTTFICVVKKDYQLSTEERLNNVAVYTDNNSLQELYSKSVIA